MNNEEVLEDLNNFTKKLMKNENVIDYSLKLEGQSEIGDNYGGEIIFFNITGKNEENKEKKYNLVMKTAQRSEALRNILPDTIYKREPVMYSEVFPTLKKFCKEMNPHFLFDMIPKSYLVIDEPKKETIIMQNLKSIGYKLHDRKKTWNLEHSLLVMKNYGKFHGISFALKEKKPELFMELFQNLPNVMPKLPNFDLDKQTKYLFEPLITYLKEIDRNELVDKYSRKLEILESLVFGQYEEKHKTIISHGDCWNNNFMFKYEDEDESIPSKVCFLDFQSSCFNSPIMDLSYNIYATCDKEILDNFDFLLKTYHKSLTETMKSLNCTKNMFTFQNLLNQWKIYGILGVISSISVIRLALMPKENAPNLANELENGKDLQDIAKVKIPEGEEYKSRVLGLLLHFGDNFL